MFAYLKFELTRMVHEPRIMIFTVLGHVEQQHTERIGVFAMYWHFVDAIWVVVLSVVYFIAR